MVLCWKVLISFGWSEKLVWLCVFLIYLDALVRSLFVLLVGESPLVVKSSRDKFFDAFRSFL